jgi:hypothetical protein
VIDGVDVWADEWEHEPEPGPPVLTRLSTDNLVPMSGAYVVVDESSWSRYPLGVAYIYRVGAARFAAAETSNGVYGFWVPDDEVDR